VLNDISRQSSLGQPTLQAYFGLNEKKNASNLTGAMVCMQNVGGALGVVAVGYVSDAFGRKSAFIFGYL
jgi:MFS family permease